MDNASYIGLSLQMALKTELDVVANNIANVSTAGYQGQHVMFNEYLAEPVAGETISYVYDVAVMRDTHPGPQTPTGNPLDVALTDESYFVVENDQGFRYTRNGSFRLNAEGQLVGPQGAAVMGEGNVPFFFAPEETEISISRDGTVSTENGAIGRLRLVKFDNPQTMRKVGDALFESDDPAIPAPNAEVMQGFIETANVRPVLELTRLIEIARAYQSAQRIIESEAKLEEEAIKTLTGQG